MKNRENLLEELKEIAPNLAKMKRQKVDFQVPENFFEQLSDKVIEQYKAENQMVSLPKKKTKTQLDHWLDVLQQLFQPKPVMALATVILLIVAGLFLLQSPADSGAEISLSEIPIEDLEDYLNENIEEFDATLLVDGSEDLWQGDRAQEDDYEQFFEEIIEEYELEDLL